jgi:hypothetical protein
MSLTFKPDWEETKERFQLWWDHGYFGRCAISVTAPLDGVPDVEPPPDAESPEQKWFDLDWISRNREYHIARTFYGGEAFPVWNAGYSGVTGIPALLGCPIDVDMDTGWNDPILTDSDDLDVRRFRIDETGELFRFMYRMLERAVAESKGRYIPSIGAFGGGGDTLAALRGTEQMLIDCIERPNEVREAEEYLMDMWMEFYDTCYSVIHDASEGSTCWFGLWSPGKFYASQNDFSYNIGPDMFRDIFLNAIRRQTEFLDHSVYHVDGVNAFSHVDALCELPQLQSVQIAPGAGSPSPLYYEDVLKKVQAAGKNLHITLAPDEVEAALSMLSARGLFIATWTDTQAQAEELLAQAERWSVDRG